MQQDKDHVMKLKDITVETLNEYDKIKEETRITNLTRDSVMKLADELHEAKQQYVLLEVKAKIRVLSLYYQHGFDVDEIAEMLRLNKRTVRSWLK